MWNYEKRLQYPVNITTPNAKIAQFILSQYGGPDGEISASLRYLSQRYSMPNRMAAAVLSDIGNEGLLLHNQKSNLSIFRFFYTFSILYDTINYICFNMRYQII